MMASASKRPSVDFKSLDEASGQIFNDEDSAEGMESGEVNDLDQQLKNKTAKRSHLTLHECIVYQCKYMLFRLSFCI